MTKLYDEETNEEIETGSVRETFRGERVRVEGFTPPRHPGSSGRVLVRFLAPDNGYTMSYFPSVIGAVIR